MKVYFALSMLCCLVPSTLLAQRDSPATTAEELVKRMVSPNKPVNPKPDNSVDFPRSYDHKAQKRVEQAEDALVKMGFEAIPALIKHLDDKHYCRTLVYGALHDKTVGDECFRIIDKITNPDIHPDFDALPKAQFRSIKGHPMRLAVDGDWDHVGLSYFDLIIHRDKAITRKSIDSWWEGFADKSLDHIHLAAVQRLIKHEEEIGFYPDSNKERYLKPYRDLEKKLKSRIEAE